MGPPWSATLLGMERLALGLTTKKVTLLLAAS